MSFYTVHQFGKPVPQMTFNQELSLHLNLLCTLGNDRKHIISLYDKYECIHF